MIRSARLRAADAVSAGVGQDPGIAASRSRCLTTSGDGLGEADHERRLLGHDLHDRADDRRDDGRCRRLERCARLRRGSDRGCRGSQFRLDVGDPIAHIRGSAAKFPNARPSMLLDHNAGAPRRIDAIIGAIPRVGSRSICRRQSMTRWSAHQGARAQDAGKLKLESATNKIPRREPGVDHDCLCGS